MRMQPGRPGCGTGEKHDSDAQVAVTGRNLAN
jgi:hypothetical protein